MESMFCNNTQFYDGFEGEEAVVFLSPNIPELSVTIWMGYVDSILDQASLDGKGWTGFTRDYHEMRGPFSIHATGAVLIDSEDYLNDIKQYSTFSYSDPDISEVYNIITRLLTASVQQKFRIGIMVS